MTNTTKKELLNIFLAFLVWRISLFFIAAIAGNFFKYDPSFPYSVDLLTHFNLPQWLYSWANFDGVHYITITNKGYIGTGLIQAFFPFFPYLSRLPNLIINNTIISQLLVSNLSFLSLLIVWYFFVKQRYTKRLAVIATAILLTFPTSFFFGAIYNESLFLTTVLLAFWSVEKKRYFLSAILVAIASSTRVVGIVLIPALLIEILFENYNFQELFKRLFRNIVRLNLWKNTSSSFFSFKKSSNKFRSNMQIFKKYLFNLNLKNKIMPIIIISLGSLGLLIYMLFLYLEFKDPLYFFHVQSEFGGGIRQETIVTYPQVIFRYIKILLTARPFDIKYLSYLREFIIGIIGLAILIYSTTKVKFSYVFFALIAFILPTLTGTFSSMPRYVLVSFPIFIVLSIWIEKNNKLKYFWFVYSTAALIFNTMLFIQGYWIA